MFDSESLEGLAIVLWHPMNWKVSSLEQGVDRQDRRMARYTGDVKEHVGFNGIYPPGN